MNPYLPCLWQGPHARYAPYGPYRYQERRSAQDAAWLNNVQQMPLPLISD